LIDEALIVNIHVIHAEVKGEFGCTKVWKELVLHEPFLKAF
jgi:hypothetical protein